MRYYDRCKCLRPSRQTMTHMGSTTSAQFRLQGTTSFGRLITTILICTCTRQIQVTRLSLHVCLPSCWQRSIKQLQFESPMHTQAGQCSSSIPKHFNTNTAKPLYAKWDRSYYCRHQFNSNTVFAITVLTLHFKSQCLAKIANTALPNTVFALLFNKNNDLIFWTARFGKEIEPRTNQ